MILALRILGNQGYNVLYVIFFWRFFKFNPRNCDSGMDDFRKIKL